MSYRDEGYIDTGTHFLNVITAQPRRYRRFLFLVYYHIIRYRDRRPATGETEEQVFQQITWIYGEIIYSAAITFNDRDRVDIKLLVATIRNDC